MGWETVAMAKKASLLSLIPQPWKINPADVPSTATLTDSPADKILEKIRSLEWTSLDVTRAFCHRAALAHQLVCINCGISSFCYSS